jgi:hypothetical protein
LGSIVEQNNVDYNVDIALLMVQIEGLNLVVVVAVGGGGDVAVVAVGEVVKFVGNDTDFARKELIVAAAAAAAVVVVVETDQIITEVVVAEQIVGGRLQLIIVAFPHTWLDNDVTIGLMLGQVAD